MLIALSGLPATGKSTIASALARTIGAVHLRIDTIEQAVVRAGAGTHPLGAVGYVIGYALAADHLRQGLTVVADSVNPITVTRDAWRDVARAAGVDHLDVEVVCSDPVEHERRATTRTADIPDLRLPTWADIRGREYEPWDRDRVILDTLQIGVTESLARLVSLLPRSISRAQPAGGVTA